MGNVSLGQFRLLGVCSSFYWLPRGRGGSYYKMLWNATVPFRSASLICSQNQELVCFYKRLVSTPTKNHSISVFLSYGNPSTILLPLKYSSFCGSLISPIKKYIQLKWTILGCSAPCWSFCCCCSRPWTLTSCCWGEFSTNLQYKMFLWE